MKHGFLHLIFTSVIALRVPIINTEEIMTSSIYKSILLSMNAVTLFSGFISEALTVNAATGITSSNTGNNEVNELLS